MQGTLVKVQQQIKQVQQSLEKTTKTGLETLQSSMQPTIDDLGTKLEQVVDEQLKQRPTVDQVQQMIERAAKQMATKEVVQQIGQKLNDKITKVQQTQFGQKFESAAEKQLNEKACIEKLEALQTQLDQLR